MTKLVCTICGGHIVADDDEKTTVCMFCSSTLPVPEEDDPRASMNNAQAGQESLLKRGYMYLEDTEWDKADEYMERILDADPECARAYLGKLLAAEGATSLDVLRVGRSSLKLKRNFQKARRFAPPAFAALLDDVEAQRAYNAGLPGAEDPSYSSDDVRRVPQEKNTGKEEPVIAQTEDTAKDIVWETREYFGEYQDAPISWLVLKEGTTFSLLIAKEGLDVRPYSDTPGGVNWGSGDMRAWLNGEFLQAAFTPAEQQYIATTRVTAEKSNMPGCKAKEGRDTEDKIFLLSISEFKAYFASEEEGYCRPSAYAKAAGTKVETGEVSIEGIGNGEWWLRNQGLTDTYAVMVTTYGEPFIYGKNITTDGVMVRPALWVRNEILEKQGIERDWRSHVVSGSAAASAISEELGVFGWYHGALQWQILGYRDDYALVLCGEVVDCKPFNKEYGEVSWEDCSLRAWLNDEFLKTAFNEDEQKRIAWIVNGKLCDELPDDMKGKLCMAAADEQADEEQDVDVPAARAGENTGENAAGDGEHLAKESAEDTATDAGIEEGEDTGIDAEIISGALARAALETAEGAPRTLLRKPSLVVGAEPVGAHAAHAKQKTQQIERIFLLSIEEAEELLESSEARQCEATRYARKNGVFLNDGLYHPEKLGYCIWWLRSEGFDESSAAVVDEGGYPDEKGLTVSEPGIGVRPAMWIKMEAQTDKEDDEVTGR